MSDELRRVRAPVVRIVDHGDATTVIGQVARRFDGDSAALLRAVLAIHARPTTRTELFAELARLAGGEVPAAPVDELVALLVADGVLVTPVPARAIAATRRVVLAISGAVAAVDAPQIIRALHAAGCDVRVALSRTAKRFVAVAALQALTHHQVWGGIWQRDARMPVPHVNLAEWAELVLVYPASATTLARIAAGDCSDLVSAIATATRAPVIVVPSMNDAMYGSPPVQASLETLRAHGRHVVHPALGLEVAHAPAARAPMLGAAPPAAAVVDIVLHVLHQTAPRMPATPAEWEQLWATTPRDHLPWAFELEPELAAALAARPPGRLLDLGTGDGSVAIAAARRGFRVTATDIAPSALGRARARAGELPIVFALDDATAPRLDGEFAVIVDRGVLHCLPPAQRAAYAAGVARLLAPGGELLVVAHTERLGADELAPTFAVRRSTPTMLSGAPAALHELVASSDAAR